IEQATLPVVGAIGRSFVGGAAGWRSLAPSDVGFAPDAYFTDLADMNGDGLVDGVEFETTISNDLPIGKQGAACYTSDFWNMCGALDPTARGGGIDICAISDTCESITDLPLSTCAAGTCVVTP